MPDQPLADLQKPYIVMREALNKVPRDIVYSLCQYGMGKVWEWGEKVGGNFWRTTGDLTDVWSNMAAVGFRQAGREQWSKPGHWTDPDMLVIGKVGWGPNIHDTRLTPNEQITHITLWTIQAAPLLIGADMAQFDKFTTDLMTNHEVLEVNQDVLGRGGSRVVQDHRLEVWVRPLADGTKAVALFNRGLQAATVTMRWSDIGVSGQQVVRDLWQQRDLGHVRGSVQCDGAGARGDAGEGGVTAVAMMTSIEPSAYGLCLWTCQRRPSTRYRSLSARCQKYA